MTARAQQALSSPMSHVYRSVTCCQNVHGVLISYKIAATISSHLNAKRRFFQSRKIGKEQQKRGAIRFTPQLGIFVVLWLIEKQNRVIRSNCQELCFHRETRISGLKKAEPLTVELIKYVSEPLPMLDLLF